MRKMREVRMRKLRMAWMRMRKENEKGEIEKDDYELSFLIVTPFCTKLVRLSPTHISILVHYLQVSAYNSCRQGYATISSIEACTKILLQRTTLQLQGPMI